MDPDTGKGGEITEVTEITETDKTPEEIAIEIIGLMVGMQS
jgi:hypothetical protein